MSSCNIRGYIHKVLATYLPKCDVKNGDINGYAEIDEEKAMKPHH